MGPEWKFLLRKEYFFPAIGISWVETDTNCADRGDSGPQTSGRAPWAVTGLRGVVGSSLRALPTETGLASRYPNRLKTHPNGASYANDLILLGQVSLFGVTPGSTSRRFH